MGKHPEPLQVEIDGTEMVLLEAAVYEQLRAHHRQLGAQSARMHELRHRVELLDACLDDLMLHVLQLPACPECPGAECSATELDCPRRRLLTLLTNRPTGEATRRVNKRRRTRR
ncbi:hypothetical protein ACG83_08680 [Frankia sp. R43]|uniref:hypothetical protein n=1 Tax=Frankia sp. R43 TaxID=269536 RepID=UPI0006C9F511|nr:hypothetical protein [Frankia sp. R43]KPM55422.1 hypothetical protein ACG83_08680 [Frankia sp. R43]